MSGQEEKDKQVQQFLALNQKQAAGKFKIYPGMSAGLGKTYHQTLV